ncbi:MAG: tetratricopeptide repeat protein [Deltaproteobacteria bacterium]|nr:tetratricopeptide repeat protein [Deltaproteobacteria bacterium]
MKRVAYLPLVLLFLLLLPGWSAAQNVQSFIDQGIKHSQAGQYDQALQAFDQALKLKPNDPALITYKGTVYYAKGNNAQAMQMCEQALKLNPNFGRAYYQRGMIYQNQEKYPQALEDLQKAKSLGYGIDPDFIELVKRKAADQK